MDKILITGASGLVGGALREHLGSTGHEVLRLVRRRPTAPDEVYWDACTTIEEPERLNGLKAVVHLAGRNIASGRWTTSVKAEIKSSRVDGTRLLSKSLAALASPPELIISASAVGYYGDRGDEILNERSAPGSGFLADTCVAWEAAAEPARKAGIRVIHARLGVVLSRAGGALKMMLPAFRLGLGGRIGNGKQYMSWVSAADLCRALYYLIGAALPGGAVNVVAPAPVTNARFTETLGTVLRRPTLFTVPGFAARIAMGDMANELLLGSARVMPRRLLDSGFVFRHNDIEPTLRELL